MLAAPDKDDVDSLKTLVRNSNNNDLMIKAIIGLWSPPTTTLLHLWNLIVCSDSVYYRWLSVYIRAVLLRARIKIFCPKMPFSYTYS